MKKHLSGADTDEILHDNNELASLAFAEFFYVQSKLGIAYSKSVSCVIL